MFVTGTRWLGRRAPPMLGACGCGTVGDQVAPARLRFGWPVLAWGGEVSRGSLPEWRARQGTGGSAEGDGRAVVRTVAAGWLASVVVAGALPTPTFATSPTRIDLFDPRGNRTGSGVVDGDRVDLFDARGNRTGSGAIGDGRRVDFFGPRGNRTGYAVIEGARLDTFDERSNRMGSGRIRNGAVETFNRQGN